MILVQQAGRVSHEPSPSQAESKNGPSPNRATSIESLDCSDAHFVRRLLHAWGHSRIWKDSFLAILRGDLALSVGQVPNERIVTVLRVLI